MRYELVAVDKIEVPTERKRDPGDITTLARSIEIEGLHQPILLGEDYTLAAGLRRLTAFKLLGRKKIPAIVKTFPELWDTLAELTENLERKELSELEYAEHIDETNQILMALGVKKPSHRPPQYKPEVKVANLAISAVSEAGEGCEAEDADQQEGGKAEPKATDLQSQSAQSVGNEELAKSLNISKRKLRRQFQIARLPGGLREKIKKTELADNQRELERLTQYPWQDQILIVSVIENGEAKTVGEAVRSLQRGIAGIKAQNAPDPTQDNGRYQTIVIDPPWDGRDSGDDNPFGKIRPAYPVMSIDRIRDLPIPALGEDTDCHLYLWVTNRMMEHGIELIKDWGFRKITILTWVKERLGTGHWFRNTTEHVIFGVRGSAPLARTDAPTHFHAKRGAHSVKPKEFYDLVRSVSPTPRLDMFARIEREGFVSWPPADQDPRRIRAVEDHKQEEGKLNAL